LSSTNHKRTAILFYKQPRSEKNSQGPKKSAKVKNNNQKAAKVKNQKSKTSQGKKKNYKTAKLFFYPAILFT
jgi:hypothetical protein